MNEADSSGFDPEGRDRSNATTESIMQAVYRALSAHGYPETTIARIAAEFEKSKSLLYYHYESKEDILVDFFAYLCDRLEADLTDQSYDDPHEHLLALIKRVLPSPTDDEQFQFRQAYFEIRSQAPHNRAYHEQIKRSDELVLDALIECIERGVETGQYREVDASRQAELVFSSLIGIMERGATLDDPAVIERNRDALVEQLESSLFAQSS